MKASGSTSEQSRLYNERTILHLVRRYPDISRAQIAKRTGLSAQTISVITASLLERELLQVTGKITGGRGQPSIKLSLNAQGAYSLGINIDRNQISAALLDFCGHTILLLEEKVSFPTESVAKTIARELIEKVKGALGNEWHKLKGIGLTRPDNMANWLESLVLDSSQRNQLAKLEKELGYWQSDSFEAWLEGDFCIPCYRANDAVAAGIREVLFPTQGNVHEHFFYLYVSTAGGGCFISDGECYLGAHGKAGRFGLLPTATGRHGKWVLEALSLSSYERFLAAANSSYDEQMEAEFASKLTTQWVSEIVTELLPAMFSVLALYDPGAVILGGRLPTPLAEQLQQELIKQLANHDILTCPALLVAQSGLSTGVLGAAILPLYESYSPQRQQLLLGTP
ncbi:ROK family transcriptional regulator [Marinomonas epiphytica]